MPVKDTHWSKLKTIFNSQVLAWTIFAGMGVCLVGAPLLVVNTAIKEEFAGLQNEARVIRNGQRLLPEEKSKCYVQTGRQQTIAWINGSLPSTEIKELILHGRSLNSQQKTEVLGRVPEYKAENDVNCEHYSEAAFFSGWAVRNADDVVAHNPQLQKIATALQEKIPTAHVGDVIRVMIPRPH